MTAAAVNEREEIGRALEPSWYEKVNGVSHAELTMTTYKTLKRIIRDDRGLEFSQAHWDVLFALCMTLTSVAQGKKDERIVWGLPTGGAKTSTPLFSKCWDIDWCSYLSINPNVWDRWKT